MIHWSCVPRRPGGSAAAFAAALVALGWAMAVPTSVAHADSAAQSAPVSMKEFMFMPNRVTVVAGGTVTWTYDESASDPNPNCESPYFQSGPVTCPGHSTTAAANGPDSKPLWDSGVARASGFPYSHRFEKPGTYHYYCRVHGGPHPNNPLTHMEGDVVVVAATGAAVNSPPSGSSGAGSAPTSTPSTAAPAAGGGPAAAAVVVLGAGLWTARRKVVRGPCNPTA